MLAAILLGATVAVAAPVVTGATSASATASSNSVSHTPAGINRLLIACVVVPSPSTSVTGVTFNTSESFTKFGDIDGSDDIHVEVWYLKDPTATTANVVASLSEVKQSILGVISFRGVDQTTPIDGTNTNSGSSSTTTVNVTSESGDMVVDCMATVANPTTAPTVGAGQTLRWTRDVGGQPIRGAGSTEAGASSVTMSWGLSESKAWATVGFNLNDGSGRSRRVIIVD